MLNCVSNAAIILSLDVDAYVALYTSIRSGNISVDNCHTWVNYVNEDLTWLLEIWILLPRQHWSQFCSQALFFSDKLINCK